MEKGEFELNQILLFSILKLVLSQPLIFILKTSQQLSSPQIQSQRELSFV